MSEFGRGKIIPGFFISNFDAPAFLTKYKDMVFGELSANDWKVFRLTFDHFLNDKTLFEDDDCALVLEGVILNKIELYDQYSVSSVEELVKVMYSKKGERFFSAFRGSFSGALYDKRISQWLIWTNHYGDNAVFYFVDQDRIAVSSNFIELVKAFNSFGSLHVDEHAIASMQSTGFMSDEVTYAQEIKRLLPGHYIRISNGEFRIDQYWRVSHNAYDLSHASEDELIDLIDQSFRRAVDREFAKDREYGYRHLAELSGGLDSRMVTWVAHDLGYTDVLNITFSQANYLDELIAKQIASELNNPCMAMPLDDAGFLFDLEKIIQLNYGLTLAFGTTGVYRFLDSLDMSKYGVVHTGAAGDAILGSFLHNPSESKPVHEAGRYTRLMDDDPESHCDLSRFTDQEEYMMSTRAFLGAVTSHLVTRGFSDIGSPFLDVDFFDLCMSISPEYRCGHRIYKAWILKKYPHAADFVWEKLGTKIDAPEIAVRARGLARAVANAGFIGSIARAAALLGIKNSHAKKTVITTGMNPFDVWLKKRPAILAKWDNFFWTNINDLPVEISRKDLLTNEYESGATIEKTLALTALAGSGLLRK